jgi:membrane protein required for colicin V production
MSEFFSTNTFDLAVYVCLFVAVVMGFMTGLLRSLPTIFGYICGIGIAVAATPKAVSLLATYPKFPTPQTWIVFAAIFIAAGALISILLRLIVSGMVGPNVSVPDRIAGAALGAFPPGREPAFLKGSQWRPVLSSAAQYGLQSARAAGLSAPQSNDNGFVEKCEHDELVILAINDPLMTAAVHNARQTLPTISRFGEAAGPQHGWFCGQDRDPREEWSGILLDPPFRPCGR